MTPPPLRHADPSRPDDRLAADAAAHLSRNPGLQLVAELYTRLREMSFPWWTADQLRDAFPASQRMAWFAERPDLRQRITTQLTGLAPRAARNKAVDFQASLIDSVVDEGDIAVDVFESAFEPADIAVYAPAAEIFRLFRRRMPWDDDSTPHQDIVGWLVGALLSDKSTLDGSSRTPILSAVQIRTAIDGRVWHSRIPLHVRVAIDDARFAAQRERPHEPYGVERDLAIATPALIAASLPLRDLLGVIDVATQALGFDDGSFSRSSGREPGTRSTAPRAQEDEGVPRSPETEFGSALKALAEELDEEVARVASVRPPPPARESVRPAPVRESVRPPPVEKPKSISPPALVTAPPVEIAAPDTSRRSTPPGPLGKEVTESKRSVPPPATERRDSEPEIELHSPPTDPPQFSDEPTSGSSMRDSATDELEHTNPWMVPQLSGELAQIAKDIAKEMREARDRKKNGEEG